ncbi:hypothetical protein PO909_024643 [Leuciscus waleckii]
MSGEMSSTRERIATEDVKEQTRPSRERLEDGGRGITEERTEEWKALSERILHWAKDTSLLYNIH